MDIISTVERRAIASTGSLVRCDDIDCSLGVARLIGIASWDSLEKSCTATDGIESTLAVAMSSNELAPDTHHH